MSQPARAAKSPLGRGRPGGRTNFQEEKRRRTRAGILSAAGEVFATTAYAFATIDDILRTAGISRATFYMHFETKLALALEIYDGIREEWLHLFEQLVAIDPANHPALRSWMEALAKLYVDHGYITSLVAQLSVIEPSFRERLKNDRNVIIDRLAERGVGGFVQAVAPGEAGAVQRIRAHLLMRRLDQICSEVSIGEEMETADADRYMAQAVVELDHFIGKPPPGA